MGFLSTNCTFNLLSPELLASCDEFVCTEEDLNQFFKNDSLSYSKELFGKSYCFTLDSNPKEIVCAFTVANDSIKIKLIPNAIRNRLNRKISNSKRSLKSYPATLIGKLAVSKKHEGKGIGKELMTFIKYWFIESKNKTGCRYLVVDSYNKEGTLTYYTKNDFRPLFLNQKEEKAYIGINTNYPLASRILYFDLIEI